jgi:hypothetical protein
LNQNKRKEFYNAQSTELFAFYTIKALQREMKRKKHFHETFLIRKSLSFFLLTFPLSPIFLSCYKLTSRGDISEEIISDVLKLEYILSLRPGCDKSLKNLLKNAKLPQARRINGVGIKIKKKYLRRTMIFGKRFLIFPPPPPSREFPLEAISQSRL